MSVPAYQSIPAPRRPADDSPPGLRTVRTESFAGALALLNDARTCLHEAECRARAQDRYAAAYLAAVRAANAVLAARAAPSGKARPVSVWRSLRQVAPEFGDWAQVFAAHSERRVLAEAGVPIVAERDADVLVSCAGIFVDAVGRSLSWAAR